MGRGRPYAFETSDIESSNGLPFALTKFVQDCHDGNGFAVARWAMEYDTSLPGYLEPFVCVLSTEEALNIASDVGLHTFFENHVVPADILDGIP